MTAPIAGAASAGLTASSPYGPLLAAGLGAGASLLGSNDKAAKKQAKKAREALEQALAKQEFFQGQQRHQLETGLSELMKGFDNAEGHVSRQGKQAKRSVTDREHVARGRLDQNLFNSGFANSSVAANAGRGLEADTNRRIGEIDEGLAGMYSNLAVQRAGAQNRTRQMISSTLGKQADQSGQFADRFLNLNTTSFQSGTPALDFSGIADSLMAVLGKSGGGASWLGKSDAGLSYQGPLNK